MLKKVFQYNPSNRQEMNPRKKRKPNPELKPNLRRHPTTAINKKNQLIRKKIQPPKLKKSLSQHQQMAKRKSNHNLATTTMNHKLVLIIMLNLKAISHSKNTE